MNDGANTREILIEQALAASTNAFCPYSNFHVGAALLADGEIVTGANIEVSSFPLSLCAERVALFAAKAAGYTAITHLAVVTPDAKVGSTNAERMPCGACRQVMADLMGMNGTVFVDGVGTYSVEGLLPEAFIF